MLIGTFSVPTEAVALEQAYKQVPEMEIEAERIAATSSKWVMPCLWIANAESDSVDAALDDDPTVDRIVESVDFGDEMYYQVEWSDSVEQEINAYLDMEASILEADASSDGWRLRIRFASRDQFDAFREYLAEHNHSFQLQELIEPGEPRQSYGQLTPDQHKALVTALEQGYYDVPRNITTRELAEELGISHQALSSLLRRGTANLINTLLTTTDDSSQ